MTTLRQRIGALARDGWRYEAALRLPPAVARRLRLDVVSLRNRTERLEWEDHGGPGARCLWRWSSDLAACKVLPSLGRRVLAACLREWPIAFSSAPLWSAGAPVVSFVLGHRGEARKPLLMAVLESLFAQEGVAAECIVVEQGDTPVLGVLPPGVRHVFTPVPPDRPFNRAQAFNAGVRIARGEIVVCHDGDICVPRRYSAELLRRLQTHDAAQLQRFVFYLGPETTAERVAAGSGLAGCTPVRVRQNSQGGSIALRRRAYLELGGHDESFVGWGGEDNEFHERCRTRSFCDFGYLPLVHLWHPERSGRSSAAGVGVAMATHFAQRMSVPPLERVRELRARAAGVPDGGADPVPFGDQLR